MRGRISVEEKFVVDKAVIEELRKIDNLASRDPWVPVARQIYLYGQVIVHTVRREDATFIAAVRNLLPTLLDYIEELWGDMEELQLVNKLHSDKACEKLDKVIASLDRFLEDNSNASG